MIRIGIRNLTLSLAATSLALSAPAAAYGLPQGDAVRTMPVMQQLAQSQAYGDDHRYDRWERKRDRQERRYARQRARAYDAQGYSSYGEPVYRDTRVWRGDDGRYYCRKSNGTTGLLIGGAAGALLGREIAGRGGDRTLGAILGAAGGALLGKSLDSGTRCN